MKRLALLTFTAFLAVVLSACGPQSEKKVEENATVTTDQPTQPTQPGTDTMDTTGTNGTTGTTTDTTKPNQ